MKIWYLTFTKAIFQRLDQGSHARDKDDAAIALLDGTYYIRWVDLARATARLGQICTTISWKGFHFRDDI